MKKLSFVNICAALVYLCFSVEVYAQQKLVDRPEIEDVTVDYKTGEITIEWKMPNPPKSECPVEEFEIFWYKEEIIGGQSQGNYIKITTVDPTQRSYTFNFDDPVITSNPYLNDMPDPRHNSVPFSVAANCNSCECSKSLLAYDHYNTQLTGSFDSCKYEIKFDWKKYQGWVTNLPPYKPFKRYILMGVPEDLSMPHVEIESFSSQLTTSYILKHDNAKGDFFDLKKNKIYTYYIIAERNDGLQATSYRTEVSTKMRTAPTYINAISTEYTDEGFAQVRFELDPAAQTHLYEFMGTDNFNYSFVSLGKYTILANDTVLTDMPDNKRIRESTYYYILHAWHVCMNKHTATSNMATAMWLKVKQEQSGAKNSLEWSPFKKWKNGENDRDAQYEIWRKIGEGAEVNIGTIYDDPSDPSKINFSDEVTETIDGEICYWIKATPIPQYSPYEYAISNSFCITATRITSNPELASVNQIHAWMRNGLLHIEGLTIGETLNIYSATGALVYQSVATSETADISLSTQGVYIIQSEGKTVKVLM